MTVSRPSYVPEARTFAYCPKHGDVSGRTEWRHPRMFYGEPIPEKREYCCCGNAVTRARYVLDASNGPYSKLGG